VVSVLMQNAGSRADVRVYGRQKDGFCVMHLAQLEQQEAPEDGFVDVRVVQENGLVQVGNHACSPHQVTVQGFRQRIR
jgi:hypothetical protein